MLTPVFAAVLLRDRISGVAWFAVALATIGLAVLSLRGFAVGIGEAQTLVAAAIYALHIIALGRWSTSDTAVGLATVQAGVIATICFVAAPARWPHPAALHRAVDLDALHGARRGSLALWAQTWAQAHLTATKAAIVMSLEPVMAAFFAVPRRRVVDHTHAGIGGALVIGATYLVELRPACDPAATALEDPPAEALHHEA